MIGCNASQAPAALPRRSLGADFTRTERFRQERIERRESVIRGTQPVQRTAGVLKRGVGQQYGEILLSVNDRPEAAHVGIDHAAVRQAYAVWRQSAEAAFDRAASAVRASGATVDGRDASGDVLYILGRYRESLALPPVAASEPAMFRLEEELWA